MENFLSENASAVFGLLGAIGGGLVSFFSSLILKKSDFQFRMWDKLAERRIKAHESVIALALDLRVMVPLGGLDENNELRRTPKILLSKNDFENWLVKFSDESHSVTTWLTLEAGRELNFVQDYLISLHQNLSNAPTRKYPLIGELIRMDLINLSSSLERSAFDFFQNRIHKLQLDSLSGWHKYDREKTEARFNETMLAKNWQRIVEL